MATPQVGGIRTSGERERIQSGVEPDLSVPEALNKKFKHVFQSRKAAFIISLKRRRIHYLPDGGKDESVPETTAGSRLDMVRFIDHFYRTDDDEVAAAFEAIGKQKP
jgi:hypothetical protein